jgi:hypothetical protein
MSPNLPLFLKWNGHYKCFPHVSKLLRCSCYIIDIYIRPNNLSLVLFGHFFFFFLNTKTYPKKKCLNNKKEIYNDKYRHTRDRLLGLHIYVTHHKKQTLVNFIYCKLIFFVGYQFLWFLLVSSNCKIQCITKSIIYTREIMSKYQNHEFKC